MRWSIVVMEAPIACCPQLRSLAPHNITLATEDIPVVLFGDFFDSVVRTRGVQWKSDEITKKYLTQMLLAINWRYWQAGKYSRMRMKVKGQLMQAHFFEIHQVFARKGRTLFQQYIWTFTHTHTHRKICSLKCWIIIHEVFWTLHWTSGSPQAIELVPKSENGCVRLAIMYNL